LLQASTTLQCHLRVYNASASYHSLRNAAVILQTATRRSLCRIQFLQQQQAATLFQTLYRAGYESQKYSTLQESTVVLQTYLRRAKPRAYFVGLKKYLVLAQSVVRRHLVKHQIRVLLSARFVEIQKDILRLWDKESVSLLRRSAFLLIFSAMTISNFAIHLEELKRLQKPEGESSSSTTKHKANNNNNKVALESEYFHTLLGNYHPAGGINQVYVRWGVDATGKNRKRVLVQQMFAKGNSSDDEYIKLCVDWADLVMSLVGARKACDERAHAKKFTMKDFDQFIEECEYDVRGKAVGNKKGCCTIV